MGFFKNIGNGLNKARDWVFADEEKMRKVQSENYKDVSTETNVEEKKETDGKYDAWEEIDNFKMNFFLGSWATRKFKGSRVIGEDKVKKELEELERKRAAKEGRPFDNYLEEKSTGSEKRTYRSSLEEDLEKVERNRQEKKRRKEEKKNK